MQRLLYIGRVLLRKSVVRSLISGGVSVMLQTAIFEVLAIWLKLVAPSTATVIGGEAGILLNFFLNNRFSFGHVTPRTSLLSRLLQFHLVVSGALLIQYVSVYIAERSTESIVTLHAVYLGSIIVSFCWNYSWYKLWIWRHRSLGSENSGPPHEPNP